MQFPIWKSNVYLAALFKVETFLYLIRQMDVVTESTCGGIEMYHKNCGRVCSFFLVIACLYFPAESLGQESNVSERSPKKTTKNPVEDELLHRLESEFIELSKASPNSLDLEKAEQLLAETNNSSHWTNYSKATKILKKSRDKAAIPLLLWYMVEHADRSACHVMIPEYRKTITLISGHEIEPMYVAGPDLKERMRTQVQELVNRWWDPIKDSLVIDTKEISDSQLKVFVASLLEDIRDNSDFDNSGDRADNAYDTYHHVYYDIPEDSSYDRYELPELHPEIIPVVLETYGRGRNSTDERIAIARFPYEAVILLSELAKNGQRESVLQAAKDNKHSSTVRLIAVLALFRSGESIQDGIIVELLATEPLLENRLIMIMSLMWGAQDVIPVLIENMDDPNIEIATAAACALREFKPAEAVPKFQRLLNRVHGRSPSLIMSALAEFNTPESREVLAEYLRSALDGDGEEKYLDDILYAFIDACDLPRPKYRRSEIDVREQAILALSTYESLAATEAAYLRQLDAKVENARQRLKVSMQIQELRQSEYKRLLTLQGDQVITPAESGRAAEALQQVTQEVEEAQKTLNKLLAEQESRKSN